jgi:DNA replication protein DnaC
MEVRSRDLGPVRRLGRVEPEMLRRMTFETFDARGNYPSDDQRASLEGGFGAAKNFAVDPHGWLTLSGDTGIGKTHLAVAIAGERLQRGHPVFFAFVPELLDYLRTTYSPDSRLEYDNLLEEIKSAPLLILDDLGKERSTPWAIEKLYQIVVHRHNARLPTVVTTMVDFTLEREPIGSRVQDPAVGQFIKIDAPDYRNQAPGYRNQAKEHTGRRTRPRRSARRAGGD